MRFFAFIAALGLLAACAPQPQTANRFANWHPVGDSYQVALANNYRSYAEEFAKTYDWDISNYFADKALRAAAGESVEPEDPGAWKFSEGEQTELNAQRARLMQVLDFNRQTQPEIAASAVLAYDRWLVLKDRNPDEKPVGEQYGVFAALMEKMEQAHVASDTSIVPPPTIPSEVERTVLYFPFDSAVLGDSALSALAQLAREVPDADDVSIAINGHADRAGPEAYNMKLSERRAKFVEGELAREGIPQKRMQHFAFGESDPAVATEDGVPEPKNRRVEVTVE